MDLQCAGTLKTADLRRLQTTGLKIEQVGDSLDHFVGSFPGPSGALAHGENVTRWREAADTLDNAGSPYEGGRFEVDIRSSRLLLPMPPQSAELTDLFPLNRASASVPV